MKRSKGKKITKKIAKAIDRKSSGPGKAAVAAGVATAGVIGVGVATAVKRRRNGSDKSTFHVVPNDDGWALTREGDASPLQIFDRKRSAVSAGREVARSSEPSKLVIHTSDGKVQRSHEYADA